MELQAFILQYGYAVVLVWAMFEGESVLLAAGFLAQQGLLDPVAVALAAAAGGFLADNALFHAGRLFGPQLLARYPRLRAQCERLLSVARRHRDLLTAGCRFLYGLRVPAPLTLGTAGIPSLRFAALNAPAALAWGALYTAVGWYAGEAVQRWLVEWEGAGWLLAGLLVALAAAVWGTHRLLGRLHRRR